MAAADIITGAISNANEMRASADSALGQALARLGSPVSVPVSGQMDLGGTALQPFDLGTAPTYSGPGYEAPAQTFGAAPTMDLIPQSSYGTAPALSATKPTYVAPATPSQLRTFDVAPPTTDDLYVPPPPDALYDLNLTPPTLTDITIPDAPVVVLPEFLATAPDTDIGTPTDFAEQFEYNYAGMSVSMRNALNGAVDAYLNSINPEFSAQMAKLEARLSEYMDGGTALPVEVEQAIFNRARDKTNGEYLKTRDQITKEGAARGFTIPGGAMYSALAQARQAGADNNARAAMDIAIKQAELEQQNIQFALTQSANLRGVVLNAAMAFLGNMVQLNGQAIEYAKSVLQAAIALYETMVKIATARIEIYKAEAQVYEIRLKAVLAVYDVFRAQVDALRAQVDVDRARVDAFSAQANAYGALANAYKAVIDGVAAKADIEKLKVSIFEAQVRSFSAEVGAKQAEWQGFTAQVQGETAKLGAYETQVKAYGEEVRAYGAKIQAYETEVKAVTARNEGAYKSYGAAVQAYVALVSGASEAVKAAVAAYSGEIQGYVANATAKEAVAKVQITEREMVLRTMTSKYGADMQAAISSMSAYNSYMVGAANVAVSAGGVYGQMAGSAMAGVNALGADITNTQV